MSMAKEMGVSRVSFSVEDTESNILNLNNNAVLPTTLIVYQDTPLFISASCIRSNTCAQCDHQDRWIDLKKDGISYQALSSHCQLMLFGRKPYCISPLAEKFRPDFYRADFCYKKYTTEQVLQIFTKLRKFEPIVNTVSANIERNVDLF
jgi:hypothetical protein